MTQPLIRRRDAAQKTLDQFKDKPFAYGTRDCVRMAASHLRRMGHSIKLPASGSYRSPRSGLKALRARGFSTLREALDGMGFERIAPAAANVGDIIEMPGIDQIGALAIAMGGGRVLGFHEDAVGACVMEPIDIETAWRVDPRG